MKKFILCLILFTSFKPLFSQQFSFGCYFNMPIVASFSLVSTDLDYLSDADGVYHFAKINNKTQFNYSLPNTNLMLKFQYSYRRWDFVALPTLVRARSVGFILNTVTYDGEEAEYKASHLSVGTGFQFQLRYTFLNRPGYRLKLAGGLNYNYWFLYNEWESFRVKELFNSGVSASLSETDLPMYNLMYKNSPHFPSYKLGLGVGLNQGGGFYHQIYVFFEKQFGKIGNGDFFVSQVNVEWDLQFPMRSNFKRRMIYFNED